MEGKKISIQDLVIEYNVYKKKEGKGWAWQLLLWEEWSKQVFGLHASF